MKTISFFRRLHFYYRPVFGTPACTVGGGKRSFNAIYAQIYSRQVSVRVRVRSPQFPRGAFRDATGTVAFHHIRRTLT